MYLGNGQIIEAPRTGLTVRVRNLYDSDFTSRPTYAVNMDKYYNQSA
jgi:cell wall-associated NlpC family hydrolase